MRNRRFIAALLASTLSAAPAVLGVTPAHAQDPKVEAGTHFQNGIALYREEDFRAALIEFKRAYDLSPHWSVLFNIGQSHYQLRDYANALRAFEKYLVDGGAQIPEDKRKIVDTEMGELRGRVAKVTVTTNLPGAEVTIDDEPVGKAPLPAAVLVSAGRRKIGATYSGRPPVFKTQEFAGGDALTVSLEFAEPTRVNIVAPPTAPAASPVPMYVALGVGGVGVVVGSIFGAIAVGNKSDLDKVCGVKTQCPTGAQSNIDALSRNATLSTVGFVVGAAGLGTALIYWIVTRTPKEEAAPAAESPSSATARVRVAPWIGLGSAGLSGSF